MSSDEVADPLEITAADEADVGTNPELERLNTFWHG
jgi:hypothetical protein